MLQFVADLNSKKISLRPVSSLNVIGATLLSATGFTDAIPGGSSDYLSTDYEHRSTEFVRVLATQDVVALNNMQEHIQSRIKALPNDGRDVGAVRYYRCDDLIVAYVVAPKHNIDPGMDTAMKEVCGPIIAKYP